MDSIQINQFESISTVQKLLKADSQTGRVGGFLIVIDELKRVIGTISDSDIRRHMPEILNNRIHSAFQIMNSDFISISNDLQFTEIPEVVFKKLGTRRVENRVPINFVPILDSEGRLSSIVHISDLIPVLEYSSREILIFGQGFVGITLAMAMVDFGLKIIAIESNNSVRQDIEKLKPRVHEPHLRDILVNHLNGNYKILGDDWSKLPRPQSFSRRIYIIAVGTPLKPSKDGKEVDLEALYAVVDDISPHLKFGDSVVIRSTVPPGTTRKIAERMAGKFALRAGFDFHLAYAPERTVEGNAIAEVSRLPQLIGGYTNECARQVANLFSEFVNSVIICENLEAAELGKLVTNSFRDVKFAFANEVAQLATSSNVDVIRMIEDINLGYARNSIPFPSPGVGGPCLTKDSYMLGIANREESVILSARLLNHSMISFTSNKIKNIAESHKGKVLAIGLAFKGVPATNDLRESTPIEICRELIAAGLDVSAIDAVVNQDEILSQGIPVFDNSNSGYSVVCILNNNPSNVKIFLNLLREWEAKNNLTTLALFDPWGLVTPSDIRKYSIKRFTLSSQVEIE